MWWMGREQVCGAARRTGVVVAVVLVMVLCSPSLAGNCQSHISVTGGATVTGDADTLSVTLLLRETTEVGRLLYRLAWGEEVFAPSIPEPEEFASYFHVDDSVSGELRIILKRSLVGLPDYPVLKTNISALVVFPAFHDGMQCSVLLSHLLQDDNTDAPTVMTSHSFLQVAKNFPVSTPLQGFTVTVTDNDATAPNNQTELGVGGACPLAAATATEGTEARRYGGAAVRKHLFHLHLTSPLHDLGNETFTCTLRVTDMGSPALSSSVTFTLHVVEGETPIATTVTASASTDTPPHLALPFYLAEVWPGMDAGTPLATSPEPVKVNEGDPTLPKVTYTLRDAWPGGNGSEYFSINSATGQVRLRRTVDAILTAAEGDSGGSGEFVPLVIQAQDSSGRVSTAILQVKMRSTDNLKQTTPDLQPSNRLVSSSHPQPSNYFASQSRSQPSTYSASPSHPQPSIYSASSPIPDSPSHPQPSISSASSTHLQPPIYPAKVSLPASPSHPLPSPAACLCPAPRSRGLASLGFSRLRYAAEVFPTDTFVGRVEARMTGRLGGLVRYSWAPGSNTTGFLVNSTSGVITVAPAGVSPGPHHLTVRATAGRLSATAQVTVRVLEEEAEEEERKTKKKQDGGDDAFMGLRSNSRRACDSEELLRLQVAVGVLASLLGIVLLGAGVAGVLLYRRRKARAQTEVKSISTLGSAYPNLSFSRDSPE